MFLLSLLNSHDATCSSSWHLHCYARHAVRQAGQIVCLLFRKAADSLWKPMSQYKSDAACIVPAFHQFTPITHRASYYIMLLYVHSLIFICTIHIAMNPLPAP